ncbi:MAG: ABC-2 transporter permease [Ruminococcus sp.]|nr:ABC-2 transporter permease [Ruminococcus sp.]MBR4622865.1 ABC-2 transporter permease [Ruminococcus sp.]
MNALLKKELKLSASILSYLFIAFGVMAMLPGYPVLCGAFFISMGIFQSFQSAREANDIVYFALLPVAKHDVVKGKFQFSVFIELCGMAVMSSLTLVRMTVLSEAKAYRENALMNANLFFLGMAFLLFGLFNLIFIGGFFKTGYKLGKPFVTHIIVCFLLIGIAESLHHIPGLEAVNAFGFDHIVLQVSLLLCGTISYILLTLWAYKLSCKRFEMIDL